MYLVSKTNPFRSREPCTSIYSVCFLNLDSILHTNVFCYSLHVLSTSILTTKGSSKMDNDQFLHNDIYAFLETNKTLKNEIQYELKQK